MKKQKKQKNNSFWIEMILNKQYFIHFGIKLFWLVCSVLYGGNGFSIIKLSIYIIIFLECW